MTILQGVQMSANRNVCAAFKTSMQTTPYKYLTEYRLSKATELLKNSDEPIGNIADSVGFRQVSHFRKVF